MPSLLSLSTPAAERTGAPRSWNQLAKTGNFHSARYGQFDITRDDLATMFRNFKEITPQAPTELPIDFDHLSMDPKAPGDGRAAGWLKDVELRADGGELWGLIEWTPEAAGLIKNRAYKFISPSFVKDHVHKDGNAIGTTLLAAAITNHPFLEGMAALTLYSFSAMGDLALTGQPSKTRHLAVLGQHVTFVPEAARTPELSDEERARIFVVKSTTEAEDGQFVRLATLDGVEFGWFRVDQLAPAPAAEQTTSEESMPTTELSRKAATFAARVKSLSNSRAARDAFDLAQKDDPEGAEAYRLAGTGREITTEPDVPAQVLTLSVRPSETFDSLATRYSIEKGIPLREAVRAVAVAHPDLAADR